MREKEKRERERERRKKREREESEKVTELREVTPRHNPHRCFLIRQIKTFFLSKKTFLGSTTKYFYLPLITPTRMMIMMVRVEPK